MSARGQRCSGVDRSRRKSVDSKFVIPSGVAHDAAEGPAVSTAAAQQAVGRQRHSQAKNGLEN